MFAAMRRASSCYIKLALGGRQMSHTHRRFVVSAILAGMPIAFISPADVRAQGMSQMPGMGDAKQETTASATGTVTAIDAAGHKITFNHGPISEINREKRGVFLGRLVAQLQLRGSHFTTADFDDAVRLALKGLTQKSAA